MSRPRLLAVLDKSVRLGRLTSICASSGFGKTVLMADYVRHSAIAYAWLRLDGMDRDPFHFMQSLSQAIDSGGVHGESARSANRPVGEHQFRYVTPLMLANRLTSAREERLLVLDDFDEVADSVSVVGIVADVLCLTGDHIHVVTISRSPLPEYLFRGLQFESRTAIVDSDNLRFDRVDTEELFQSLSIPVDAWPSLHRRLSACEGWPAAIALALKGIELGGLTRSVGDVAPHALFDLLVDALFARLDPGDRALLARVSNLERITPDLCSMCLGLDNARDVLGRLSRVTPFLEYRSSDDSFRVHGLVCQYLRRRHDTACDLTSDQHRLAASWFSDRQDVVATVRHTVAAGDYQEAAAQLDSIVPELAKVARWHAVIDLTSLLASHEEKLSVDVLLAEGRAQVGVGDLEAAVRVTSGAIGRAPTGSSTLVDLHLTRSYAHRSRGDYARAQADAETALKISSDITASQIVKVLRVLASVQASQLELEAAAGFLAEARRLAETHNLKWQRVLALSDSATLDCVGGRFLLAAEYALDAIRLADGLRYPEGRAVAAINLATARFLNGDFAFGLQMIDEVLTQVRLLDAGRCEALAWSCKGDMCNDLCDYSTSIACYRRGLALARAIDDSHLMEHTHRGLAVALGNRGDVQAGRAEIVGAAGTGSGGLLGTARADIADGTLLLIEGRPQEARDRLVRAVDALRDTKASVELARARIQLAYAVFLSEGIAAAIPPLEEAAHTISGMDSNACVIALTALMPRLWGAVESVGRLDLRAAIAEPDRRPRLATGKRGFTSAARWDDPHPDLLTPRERELVISLSEGLSRDEVSDRLGKSRSTIDKAISNIYASTGFASAHQVVAWAHRCGLFVPGEDAPTQVAAPE